MFNSKNIHLALLGIILGSAVAYVYGSYRIESERRAATEEILASSAIVDTNAPEGHPEVDEADMLALFDAALAREPNNSELLARYAEFLFSLQRYNEGVDWFERALALTPEDATLRTTMAMALYRIGRTDDAIREFQRALNTDPNQALALHNLALAFLEAKSDVPSAENALRRIEVIDPNYSGLGSLRERVAAARVANSR